jgi:hypothetical protein
VVSQKLWFEVERKLWFSTTPRPAPMSQTTTFWAKSPFKTTTLERGTGLEPATSTLGSLRQPSTSVDDHLHLKRLQSEMSEVVGDDPPPCVGKLWECGKKSRRFPCECLRMLRSLRLVFQTES